MPTKVEVIDDAIRQGLTRGKLGGVVLCSGVAHFNGAVSEEEAEAPSGAAGLRYSVPPWRAREVLIGPLREAARPFAKRLREMFAAEREWPPWALRELGLPRIEQMLGS